jgi:hypothetical protein
MAYDDDSDIDYGPDFEEPFADPAIKAGYQNALGRFIMAHNEVDFWMTGILTKSARLLRPDGSLDRLATGDFSERAINLVLLMSVAPHLALGGVGNDRLGFLNGIRNVLAHGHFDQDRYDGTYEIVSRKHRSLEAKRLSNLNADSINRHAEELEEIARHMSAVFDFIDHPVPLEYIDDLVVHLSTELWQAMQDSPQSKEAERDQT